MQPRCVLNAKHDTGEAMHHRLTCFLAVVTTAIGLGLAATSAWHRAADTIDRTLLVGLAVIAVAAVHLLPALIRRWAVAPLWVLCLIVALWGHIGFFTRALEEPGRSKVQANTSQQAQAIDEALATIKARPIAIVAKQLANTQDPSRREALQTELDESRRAAALRDLRVSLSNDSDGWRPDSATTTIANALGVPPSAVNVLAGMAMALLVELLGVLLWMEVLRPSRRVVATVSNRTVPPPRAQPLEHTADLARLRTAVALGLCRSTVADIRTFFRCSQAKANSLRRQLVSATEA